MYDVAVQVKNKIRILTYLISKDSKISILYKLYKPKNDWKIYDIEIEGVSIIQTYRSQFSQVLQSGTIDDLLVELQEPVDS
jgi:phospholipid transport system substrate-binding protein